MSIQVRIDELQAALDRLRAEAAFVHNSTAYQAGAEHVTDQIELIIARRLESLDNWTPALHGATRKHELHQLREAIRRITIPTNQ
jgi:hypothetical protein